jgi:hypothetical protein
MALSFSKVFSNASLSGAELRVSFGWLATLGGVGGCA